jgi:flagellar protein FliS
LYAGNRAHFQAVDPDRYLADQIATATPAQLTRMLFDACVGQLHLAITLIEAEDHVQARPHLARAQAIVMELRNSLSKAGGDLSIQLDALYAWVFSQLVKAQLDHDLAAAEEGLNVMTELQQAWHEVCNTVDGAPAADAANAFID